MKRLGIFSFSEESGIVDDYVLYLLRDISQSLDELCIISNDELTLESRNKLTQIAQSDIHFQKDSSFDVYAWREMMVEYYGFERLRDFDEIILFNNSFFGPIYPFEDVFNHMDGEELDFWGITSHGEMPNEKGLCPYETCPRYIQNYFLAIRKSMIQSVEFRKYWRNMESFEDADEVKYRHEVVFTRYFEDLGFKWDTYVDCEDLEDSNEEKNMDLYVYDSYNLAKDRNLPVLSIDSFTQSPKKEMEYNISINSSNLMNYLKSNTNYDVSLIFGYLTRVLDPNRIVENLNLLRIFPKNHSIDFKTDKKVLLIAHLYYEDLCEYDLGYIMNVPDFVDVLITCNTSEKQQFFEREIADKMNNRTKVITVKNRGRDMAALLIGARDIVKDYDYFCFMHDKKSNAKEFITVGMTFRDILWENNLASEDYIKSIIKEFDDNPRLGLIVPPRVHHGTYFYEYVTNYWAVNYENTVELLEELGIETPMDRDCPPVSIGNCFWAKYDALEPIFELNWTHEDFHEEPLPGDGTLSHALERAHGYVAASRGYYSEFVMTEEYARAEMFNYRHMASQTFMSLHEKASSEMNFKGFLGVKNTIGNIIKK